MTIKQDTKIDWKQKVASKNSADTEEIDEHEIVPASSAPDLRDEVQYGPRSSRAVGSGCPRAVPRAGSPARRGALGRYARSRG
ncbi:hypothetical protein, partial [Methylobacterium sp. WL2]|uniref:hypothetical protein n=1 Tax=Methylobacterium sp. WL2 TaxID=2603902 RepID=UPI001AEEA24A